MFRLLAGMELLELQVGLQTQGVEAIFMLKGTLLTPAGNKDVEDIFQSANLS